MDTLRQIGEGKGEGAILKWGIFFEILNPNLPQYPKLPNRIGKLEPTQ
jgi:hypothetical protein